MEIVSAEKENGKVTRKKFSKIGLALSAIFIISFTLQIILEIIPGLNLSTNALVWTSQIALYAVGFPLFYLILRRIPEYSSEEKQKLSLKQFLAFFAVTVASMYIFNIVGAVINLIIGNMLGSDVINPAQSLVEEMDMTFLVLIVVIIGPIMEELMFRKVILNRARVYGEKFAVIFTAFIFGLFHGNFSQFFYAFAIGSVFAYLCLKTGTILYSVILHIIINFMGSVLPLALLKALNSNPADLENLENINLEQIEPFLKLFSAYGFFLISAVVAGVVIFFKYRKKLDFNPPLSEYFNIENLKRKSYINIGMIIFYLICAFQFVTVILSSYADL